MLSMLKLLISTILLSSLAYANSSDKVEDFLEEALSKNPKLMSVNVNVLNKIPLKNEKNWNAYIVDVSAVIKPKHQKIHQKMIWFSNGSVISADLTDLATGKSLKKSIQPKFKDIYYKKRNLIYGNANAKHKVAIFSDPLCPFCREYVPEAIQYMKKYPKEFAIYFYHFPLGRLHPASVTLVKAAIVAQLKGVKDVVLKLYRVKLNPREKSIDKRLKAFNKTMKTNVSKSDIKSPQVLKIFKDDIKLGSDLMVRGTPTMYFDGVKDETKTKYKKVKIK